MKVVKVLSAPWVKAGYERIAGLSRKDDAVRWWYVRFDEEGEVTFARGGLVRTSRQARHAIDATRLIADKELEERKHKPTHRMTKTGDLIPL